MAPCAAKHQRGPFVARRTRGLLIAQSQMEDIALLSDDEAFDNLLALFWSTILAEACSSYVSQASGASGGGS